MLKTIKPFTSKAEILDHVYQWFIVDEKPFGHDGVSCVYLGGNGERCAIGCLLVGNEADDEAELRNLRGAVYDVDECLPENLRQLDPKGEFLYALQAKHDACAFWSDREGFGKGLQLIARRFGLPVPGLEN